MKIRYLQSAAADIAWMRRYYRIVFPQGSNRARQNYRAASVALANNPRIGHPVAFVEGAREYRIPRTPFSFIYRIDEDAIEVIRILDGRSEDSNDIA